jgi:hypothetical protein
MAPSQQAGPIVSWAGSLQKNLTKRDQEWDKVEKLLDRFPHLRSEVQLLEIKVDSIKRERDQLQDPGRLQKEENEQWAKQLKNAKVALALEEGIQKSLAVAAEVAKMILEVDKGQLIQKELEQLYKEEATPFIKLYKSMQHFSNDIIQVQEGLERELKVTQEYLQVKHQPAGEGEGEER